MSKQKTFKTALIGSTALIGGSLLAPTAALAVSCPTYITDTALAGVVCAFDSGSSVTVEDAGDVGGISMNAYTPTPPSFISNAGSIINASGIGIQINSSSLSNGIANSGAIISLNGGIEISNTSTILGGLNNSGTITTLSGTGLLISNSSTISGGITNSGTISADGVFTGISILNNSTVSDGLHNSGTIAAGSGNAILVRSSSVITGGITNSGTIISDVNTGITVLNGSTVTGDIANETGGSISGGDTGLAIHNSSTINGSITNASGASISGGDVGISVYSATNITGSIQNAGIISGGNTGIRLSSSAAITGGITNSGTISGGNYGIYVDSSSNTLVNNGTINVMNASGHAMHSNNGNSNIITNNGTINFITSAYGISSSGNNNTLTNNGFMEVHHGITASGTTNILANYGTILSHGVLGGGMQEATAGNSELTNYGTIIGTGDTSYGLKGVDGNLLSNHGYIRTTGPGILGVGDAIAAVNRGTIANSDAIDLTGSNNTVTLGMNSFTRGTITFTGAANTLVYDVANVPRTGGVIHVGGTITGADTVTISNTSSLPADAKIAQDGNSVAIITPEQFAGTQQIISQTLADAGTVLGNRQQLALLGDTTEAADGTQYAASSASLNDADTPGGWAVRDRKVAWAEGFGSYQERGEDGDLLDSKARAGGIMAGIDLPQSDSGYRSGVYVGGFMGTVDIGSSFRTIDSNGAMAGGYVGKSFGGTYVSGQLGFGFSNNESDRFTGVDTASADYNSYFISPALTVMHPVRHNGITWVPSATVRYTAQFDDSYTESGSVVNQSVDSHTSNSLDGRMMLEAKFAPSQWKYGTFKPSLRAGIEGQTLLGNNKVNVQALSTNMSFDPKGGDGYVDGILGAGVIHSINERFDLYGDAEANLGLNKGGADSNKGAVGRIGARWKL